MQEILKKVLECLVDIKHDAMVMSEIETHLERSIDYTISMVKDKIKELEKPKTVYERVKEERDEVKERLDKLNKFLDKVFIEGTVFISETQAHYLKEQREYMQGYLDTLDKRLEDFAKAEELKDFKEYEGRNMHFAEQIKLLKELHKEANIQGALMSAGDIERGLLHLIKENKNLCKDKVEEYLKNLERE